MNREEFYDLAGLLIRYGKVSSVNVEERTAKVFFENKKEDESMVSGDLKVLQNHPYIHLADDVEGEFTRTASYATIDRNLGYSGESFDAELPDTVSLTRTYAYETECSECTVSQTKEKTHTLSMELHPWLPKIGQWVLCLYLPSRDGDGFILGGI